MCTCRMEVEISLYRAASLITIADFPTSANAVRKPCQSEWGKLALFVGRRKLLGAVVDVAFQSKVDVGPGVLFGGL